MDVALVKDPENNVNRDKGRKDQDRFVGERIEKSKWQLDALEVTGLVQGCG